MQELIDELKLIEAYPMLPLVLKMATELLEKEKEQIIDAYINGYGVSFIDGDNRNFSRPQEYYNRTYNKNEI